MSPARSRVLVTGATGLLGQAVVLHAAEAGAEVVAAVYRRGLDIPGVRSIQVDLRDLDTTATAVSRERPTLVVHTAALVAVDQCESHAGLAALLNVTVPGRLAQVCERLGAGMVHISSDAVYGDAPGPFTEDTELRGTSVYARSKRDGERAVLEALPEALVVRTNFFGWSSSGTRSLAEFFHTALSSGRQVSGFTDVEFSPLYQRSLTELVLLAADRGIRGVRNLGSSTSMSKFAFGRAIAEVFGFDPELVEPASRHDAGLTAARSATLTMDSSRIAGELAVRLPTTREGIERLFVDFRAGLPSQLRAQLRELSDERILP
jgi:dTDP-4-dehydrorhamnose reductase